MISRRPATQAYEGLCCLYEQVVPREDIEQKNMVPIDILTRDNVKYYQD